MKARFSILLTLGVVSVIALIFILPAAFSRAQQDTAALLLQNPELAVTEEQIAALAEARRQAFLTNRIPDPVCLNCFKVGDGRYGIHEEVPGTNQVLSRDLPDPAPLQPGEVRPEYDDLTGESIWYIGTQGFVGPTDEEPLSASLPIPKIELKRIQARHEREIFDIKGMHGLGIGEKGFIVSLLPEKSKNRSLVPPFIEGIPVQVKITGMAKTMSHENRLYRPVPLGVAIVAQSAGLGGGQGSVGPHVVRDVADIGTCCTIWSLTAGHVIQFNDIAAGLAVGRVVTQGGQNWGTVTHKFQLQRCDPNCSSSSPVNDTRVNPDVAAIVQPEPTPFGMLRPCSGSSRPVRRMQFGGNDFVHGPSGVIRIPTFSSCGSDCLKLWGVMSHAPKGRLQETEATITITARDNIRKFREGPLDRVRLERGAIGGDSGGLVAWNGSGSRQV
ncbi:MAG: hypothetical protein ACRERD_14865, partial [Candidatus Binatia bacterium]